MKLGVGCLSSHHKSYPPLPSPPAMEPPASHEMPVRARGDGGGGDSAQCCDDACPAISPSRRRFHMSDICQAVWSLEKEMPSLSLARL